MKASPLHAALQTATLSIAIATTLPAYANDKNLELTTERGCFICHTIKHDDTKKIKLAPSYQEIAERYKDNKEAAEYLSKRILEGTLNRKQNWQGHGIHMRFMPPNVNVNKEEAATLANWVLQLNQNPVEDKVIQHEKMLTLASYSGCMTCHAIDVNTDHRYIPLAPAYRAVAEKYKAQDDAKKVLLDSVMNGTLNKETHWENVNMQFMPPNPALSQENAEALVGWILSL